MQKMLLALSLFLMVFIPITLLALPKTYFDEGAAVCLSVVFLDTECPACGLTRACMRLIHLEFREAYYFNKISFVALPLLAWLWIKYFWYNLRLFRSLSNR